MAGIVNEVLYGINCDYSTVNNQAVSANNGLISNGQMWIGSTATNTGGTNINVGTIASPNSTLVLGYSSPNLTMDIASSNTLGQILQSGGSPSPPFYSTATYPSTTTANQILYSSSTNVVGQITSVNNGVLISSASGVPSFLADGTTGQVLTATTGSPPSWGAAPSSFAPNSVIQVSDDFINAAFSSQVASDALVSNYPWVLTGSSNWTPVTTSSDITHIGLVQTPSVTAGTASIMLNSISSPTGGSYVLGGGAITFDFVFNIATLSNSTNRYSINIGIQDGTTAAPTNGIFLTYSDNANSGKWSYSVKKAGTPTTVNSSTAATAAWHHLTISVNAAASSVTITLDGSALGTTITNIPIVALSPIFLMTWAVGTIAAGTFQADLFYSNQTLTTTR
jgi:hypothetical protein